MDVGFFYYSLRGEKILNKVPYEEAKAWFWIRTAIWFIPSALLLSMITFEATSGFFPGMRYKLIAAVIGGGLSALMGVMAGWMSIQFVWMKENWKIAFLINAVVCAVIAETAMFIIGGFVFAYIQGKPKDPYPASFINALFNLVKIATGLAGIAGFIYGSWFALRQDKYFVEQI